MLDETAKVARLARELEHIAEPFAVLDALHQTTAPALNVYAAWRVPIFRIEVGDSFAMGKNVFPHASVPPQYWDEFWPLARKQGSSPMAQLAVVDRHPLTLTEGMRRLKLTGRERWLFDLFRKHGMRDGLYVPAGRWLVVFWSGKVLRLSARVRTAINMAAGYAAFRLDEMVTPGKLNGKVARLSPRELAALRLLSRGERTAAIAAALEISKETVRTHLRRATRKLEAKSPNHAACQALRLHLIA